MKHDDRDDPGRERQVVTSQGERQLLLLSFVAVERNGFLMYYRHLLEWSVDRSHRYTLHRFINNLYKKYNHNISTKPVFLK